jgi:hypothetical protein
VTLVIFDIRELKAKEAHKAAKGKPSPTQRAKAWVTLLIFDIRELKAKGSQNCQR